MCEYRDLKLIPIVLVGTADGINTGETRAISDDEGRKTALQYKMVNYYETNAAYGKKVNEVFKEGTIFAIFPR